MPRPAGNGIAATALLRFGYLLGEPRYLAAAERTLRAFWLPLTQHPQTHASLLVALEEVLQPTEIVILRGEAAATRRVGAASSRALYAPRRLVLAIPADATGLPPALAREGRPRRHRRLRVPRQQLLGAAGDRAGAARGTQRRAQLAQASGPPRSAGRPPQC